MALVFYALDSRGKGEDVEGLELTTVSTSLDGMPGDQLGGRHHDSGSISGDRS
jgi:hypothetical protein